MGALRVVVLHTAQCASSNPQAVGTTPKKVVPGQVISIHADHLKTQALQRALEAFAVSDRKLARWLGVSKTTARKVRIGELPVTNERLSKLPQRLLEAYRIAIAGPIQLSLF